MGWDFVVSDGVCGWPDDHPGIAALAVQIHISLERIAELEFLKPHALVTFNSDGYPRRIGPTWSYVIGEIYESDFNG